MTLQTLHPTKFDHGIILTQTPPIEHGASTVPQLEKLLAPKGAELLLQGIRDRVFVNPQRNRYDSMASSDDSVLHSAPRITPDDRHIDWNSWTAEKILRTHSVIGPLWNSFECHAKRNASEQTRVIWPLGFRKVSNCPESIRSAVREAGHPIIVGLHSNTQSVYIKTCDGHMLQACEMKLGGDNRRHFLTAARRAEIIELPKALGEAPSDYKLFECVLR